MKDISLKEKALNFSSDFDNMKPKFMVSISDGIVSIEDLIVIYNMLCTEYGVMMDRPSFNRVYAENYQVLKERIEKLKALGELNVYLSNPRSLVQKSLPEVIKYCQKNNIRIKDENGNYYSFIFHKREYEKMGILNNNFQINETSVVQPDNESYIQNINEELENIVPEEPEENIDPIQKILKTDGNKPMDSEHDQRIDVLSDKLKSVLTELYNMGLRNNDIVSEKVANNLVKLIMADVPDDRLVIYSALVYGDKFTQAEIDSMPNIIISKLNYITMEDYNSERGEFARWNI